MAHLHRGHQLARKGGRGRLRGPLSFAGCRASRREHVASGPGLGETPRGGRSPLRGGRSPLRGGRYSGQPRAPAGRCAAPRVLGQPGREGLGSDAGASGDWSRPAARRQWPPGKRAAGGASSPATWAQVRPRRQRRRTWAPRDRGGRASAGCLPAQRRPLLLLNRSNLSRLHRENKLRARCVNPGGFCGAAGPVEAPP